MAARGKRLFALFALAVAAALVIPSAVLALPAYGGTWGSQGSLQGLFESPRGVAVDGLGQVYVADTNNHRIQVFTVTGGYVREFGSFGATPAHFNSPRALDVDRYGYVYVADYLNDRIQVWTKNGVYVSSFGSSGSGNGQFDGPNGIVVEPNGEYVYVTEYWNGRVQKLRVDGTYVAKWSVSFPYGVDVDRSGNVLVCEPAGNRVRQFNSAGIYQRQYTTAAMLNPYDVSVSHDGHIDVADFDYDTVFRFNSGGGFEGTWGWTGTGPGEFDRPHGIAHAGRRIYVVDYGNHRVHSWQDDVAKISIRFAGDNRYQVATKAAGYRFPGYTNAHSAVVVCGEDRAMCDALSAGGLAGVLGAPLFLTTSAKLQNDTRHALEALRAAHGPHLMVYVLGGTGSIAPATFNAIKAINVGGTTTRIDGADRYVLSANIAGYVDQYAILYGKPVQSVLIFNAESQGAFYDALAASAASAKSTMPMLAVRKATVPNPVKKTLAGFFAGKKRYVVSGTGWVSSSVYSSVGASGRMATSGDRAVAATQIAQYARSRGWVTYENVGLANKLPDSLSGGAFIGLSDGVLLYTNATSFPSATNTFVRGIRYGSERGYLFGGTASISGGMSTSFTNALNAP